MRFDEAAKRRRFAMHHFAEVRDRDGNLVGYRLHGLYPDPYEPVHKFFEGRADAEAWFAAHVVRDDRHLYGGVNRC